MMKALTVTAPYKAEYIDEKKPVPTEKMLLVKVAKAGVCATDYSIYTGESSFVKSGQIKYPVRFGHEWSGVVEAVGGDVKNFKVGDKVVSDSGISCGECEKCKNGDYFHCTQSRSVGTIDAWDGSYAEYMYIPEYNAYRVPDNVSLDEAALIEPVGISLDAFNGFEVTKDMTVAVIGVGAIGMGAIWLAKYFGAKNVIAVGLRDNKLEIAKQVGADTVINSTKVDPVEAVKELTDGKGADMVIETAGVESALVQAIKMTKSKGRLSILSFYEKNVTIPLDEIVIRCISVRGAAGNFGNPQKVAEIMSKYETKLTPIITHRLPFDECVDVFENEKKYHDEKIKVIVEFGE